VDVRVMLWTRARKRRGGFEQKTESAALFHSHRERASPWLAPTSEPTRFFCRSPESVTRLQALQLEE
jgi:hypothetical protein